MPVGEVGRKVDATVGVPEGAEERANDVFAEWRWDMGREKLLL